MDIFTNYISCIATILRDTKDRGNPVFINPLLKINNVLSECYFRASFYFHQGYNNIFKCQSE